MKPPSSSFWSHPLCECPPLHVVHAPGTRISFGRQDSEPFVSVSPFFRNFSSLFLYIELPMFPFSLHSNIVVKT